MGELFVTNGEYAKHCADGAYWTDTMNTIAAAMDNVMNYRKACGKVYGSHRLLTEDWHFLKREINREFIRLSGMSLDQSGTRKTDGELQCLYESVRKGHYKVRRKGKAVRHERPLFDEVEGACVVYAYTGHIAKYPGLRVVKIGFTSQNLADYLRGKRIQHDPKLLASTCGDESLERHFKDRWRHRVCDGNEWLWPERDVFDWIVEAYDDLADGFREHMAEAEEIYAIWKRNW